MKRKEKTEESMEEDDINDGLWYEADDVWSDGGFDAALRMVFVNCTLDDDDDGGGDDDDDDDWWDGCCGNTDTDDGSVVLTTCWQYCGVDNFRSFRIVSSLSVLVLYWEDDDTKDSAHCEDDSVLIAVGIESILYFVSFETNEKKTLFILK